MASSDVVLAHSAFDALPLDTGRQALGPQAKKPKPNQFLRNLLREFLQPLLPPLGFVDEEEESTEGRREEEE
ncbi:hypothetical protein F2Q70_00035074 [Brassica cretica]|uniref:Uncharacterized protein n=1 Tax=Brassica cretica TaxID=69181 RepID=A0A8S9JSF9_BRACR|nr:hypothetical protein F2Q70_00035074 [Brassica cretica]